MLSNFITYEVSHRCSISTLEALSVAGLWSSILEASLDQNWWFRRVEWIVGRSLLPRLGDWKRVHNSLLDNGLVISEQQDLGCSLLVDVLYEIGADLIQTEWLMFAVVMRGDWSVFVRLVADERTGPHRANFSLLAGCEEGKLDVVKYCLQHPGFNELAHPFSTGSCPLARAIGISGNLDIVQALLQDQRFDKAVRQPGLISQALYEGRTEIALLLLSDPRTNIVSCLLIACGVGQIEVVKMLLLDPRVDASEADNCCLGTAIVCGFIDIVKLLMENETVLSVEVELNGRFHIDKAITSNRVEITKLLLPWVFAGDYQTLLVIAVRSASIEMIKLFMHEDNPITPNCLALREARRLGRIDVENLLLGK